MRSMLRSLLLLCGVGAVPLLAGAQSFPAYAGEPARARHADAIARSRQLVREVMHRTGVPGMSVTVGVNGEIVWSEGFGYADLENAVPVSPETRFRIGSVSKSVTAAAVGLLVERGQLDLDAPVQQYVPSFPRKRWPITTRQLAGHLAGVRHYRGDEMVSSRRFQTVEEGLEIFRDDTLLFEPGARYSYSSYGWNLVSAVVQGASGEPFLGFMRDHVLEPLGLRSLVADHTDSIVPHRTRFYMRTRDGGIVNAPYVDNSYKWAGGGFLSNTEDVARFGMAHLTGKLLRSETLELLWTSQHTNRGEETGYGIGWSVGTDYAGRRVVHHGGSSIGGRAYLLLFPDDEVVVALLANSSAPVSFALAWTVAEPFLGPSEAIDPESEPNLAGIYECEVAGPGPQTATLSLVGGPGAYLGRMTAGDVVAPVVRASSRGRDLRLVVMEGGFWIGNVWLRVEADRATGRWNRRALTCGVR